VTLTAVADGAADDGPVGVEPDDVFKDLLELAFDPLRERGDKRVATAD